MVAEEEVLAEEEDGEGDTMKAVGEVEDMEVGKVAMMMETTEIIEDTTEMMEVKVGIQSLAISNVNKCKTIKY